MIRLDNPSSSSVGSGGNITGSGSNTQISYFSADTIITGSNLFLYANDRLSVTNLSIVGISSTNIAVNLLSSTNIFSTNVTLTNLTISNSISSLTLAGTNISSTSLWTNTSTITNLRVNNSMTAVTLAGTNISGTTLWVTNATSTNLNATASLSSITLAGTNISGTSLWVNTSTLTNLNILNSMTANTVVGSIITGTRLLISSISALSTIITLDSASNFSGNSYSGTNLRMTGSITALNLSVTSSITGGAIIGANVTSGVDPGHTHTGGGSVTTTPSYVLNLMCANCATFTDNTSVYWGGLAGATTTPVQGIQRVYIPKTGTITDAYIVANSATMGTSEAWRQSIRVNGIVGSTTSLGDVTTSGSGYRVWSNGTLAIGITKNSYFEILSSNPTWATNPANSRLGGVIYVV